MGVAGATAFQSYNSLIPTIIGIINEYLEMLFQSYNSLIPTIAITILNDHGSVISILQ